MASYRQNLIQKFASRLRYPQLFALVGSIFVVDLFIPDMIPFADEILLGLMTVLLGSIKNRKAEEQPRVVKNVTPPDER